MFNRKSFKRIIKLESKKIDIWSLIMKDLPTLQDLFNYAVFKIPDYQRGYS